MPSIEPRPDRCGAKIPNSDPPRYCERQKLVGRPRCSRHGGKSKRGTEHPNHQGKGRSIDIPTRLADRWAMGMPGSVDDPYLTSTRKGLKLLDERIGLLLGRLDTHEAGRAWGVIRGQVIQLRQELQTFGEDVGGWTDSLAVAGAGHYMRQVGAHLREMEKALDDSRNERDTWKDLYDAMSMGGELAQAEHKRESIKSQVMTDREAKALVGALQLAITEETQEHLEIRRRIALRFRQILYAGGTPALPKADTRPVSG
jgi:hypothetical protein